MSADQIKKLQAQQEAQAMELQRMKYQNARQQQYQPDEDEYSQTRQMQYGNQPQPQVQQHQEYNQVDDQQAMIEAITNRITRQVTDNVNAYQSAVKGVDNRMQRLIDKYPAIQEDDSPLTKVARDEYARISRENPGLINTDKGAAYELAVETAAARIGARPVNAEYNPMQDYTLSANNLQANPARRSTRSGLNFLTPKILANFEAFAMNHPDFSLDTSTPQGKKNLEELNEYSERFKANQDESHLRYK